MTDSLTVIMISSEKRDILRTKTICQLGKVGINPELQIQTTQTSKNGHRDQSIIALRRAQSLENDLLFLEDDIDVSNGFARALAVARESEFDVVTFYLAGMTFYPAALKKRVLSANIEEPFTVFEPINRGRYFGSQCVLIKCHAVSNLLEIMGSDMRQFDNVLPSVGKFGAIFPNPVQHVGRKSITSAHYHFHESRSFCPDDPH